LKPGQTGVKSLVQSKGDTLDGPVKKAEVKDKVPVAKPDNSRGEYEENYNKDAKALPAGGCCNPLKDGEVSQCRREHDVHGVPFCAIDAIINNPNNKAPLPSDKPPIAKAPVVAKPAEVKVQDKMTDVLSQVKTNDYDIQNPTLKVVDKSSPVKTSIKGKGCTAENCDATRAPCCKVVPEPVKKEAVVTDAKAKSLVQTPEPSQNGWNTQMNAIKDGNIAANPTKCSNSSHKCSDVGGKKQSNSDDTCCQE
jgi:hypothetical protein